MTKQLCDFCGREFGVTGGVQSAGTEVLVLDKKELDVCTKCLPGIRRYLKQLMEAP